MTNTKHVPISHTAIWILLVLIAAMLLVACGDDGDDDADNPTPTLAASSANDDSVTDSDSADNADASDDAPTNANADSTSDTNTDMQTDTSGPAALELLETHGVGFARNLHWSPDGSVLAVSLSRGIGLLNTVDGEFRFLEGMLIDPRQVSFSPDGTRLVTAGNFTISLTPGEVYVYDVATGDLLNRWEVRNPNVAVYTPDGTQIVTGNDWGEIQFWDAETGQELRMIEVENNVFDLTFTPDGSLMAAPGGSFDETRVFDFESGEVLQTLDIGDIDLRVEFTAGGDYLFVDQRGSKIAAWDLADDALIENAFFNEEVSTYTMDVSDDGTLLALYARAMPDEADGLYILDPITFEQQTFIPYAVRSGFSTLTPTVMRISPDNTTITALVDNGTMVTWDIDSGEIINERDDFNNELVDSVLLGETLYAGGPRSEVFLFETNDAEAELQTVQFSGGSIVDKFSVSVDGESILMAYVDNIAQWQLADQQLVTLVDREEGRDNKLEVIRHQTSLNHYAVGSESGVVYIYDAETLELLHELETLAGSSVSGLSFNTDGALLGACSSSRNVALWSTEDYSLLEAYAPESELSYAAACHEVAINDDYVFIGQEFVNAVGAFSRSGGSFSEIGDFGKSARAIAFNADGSLMVVGTAENTLHVFDTETFQEVAASRDFLGIVSGAHFLPDGRIIAVSLDGTLRIFAALEA